MGGKSRWDYLKAIYVRYQKVSKPLRARILDEFCQSGLPGQIFTYDIPCRRLYRPRQGIRRRNFGDRIDEAEMSKVKTRPIRPTPHRYRPLNTDRRLA